MSSINQRTRMLAKSSCASFDPTTTDQCLFDCQCVFFREENGRCRYFERSVLPMDAKLEQDYHAERQLGSGKKAICKSCAVPYDRTSGRQLYCTQCGSDEARKARNKRAREFRYRKLLESNSQSNG